MAVINELIRTEKDDTLSFGDYTRDSKGKVDQYEFHGDYYKVKTCREITKLEKNGMFVFESVPGTSVTGFKEDEDFMVFQVEGSEDAQITLGMEEDAEYGIDLDDVSTGIVNTGFGGKLSFSVELGQKPVVVRVVKRQES